jgi:hypothetical protein
VPGILVEVSMPRSVLIAAVVPLLVAAIVIAGPLAGPAHAAFNCVGTFSNQTISGDLIVPSTATCNLQNVKITGNVQVQSGAILNLTGGVSVNGNFNATSPQGVNISGGGNHFKGSLLAKAPGFFGMQNTRVDGNVTIQDSPGNVTFFDNIVGGNVVLRSNAAGPETKEPPAKEVSGNRIGGWLDCTNNFPPPVGGGNTAKGGKRNQCASL